MGGAQCLSGRVRKISVLSGARTPDCPFCSKSLHRLRYSGPPSLKVLNPNVVWQWYPEHGGKKFFRNIGTSLSNYVTSNPSKPNMNIYRCKNIKSHKLEETWSTKLSRPKSSFKTEKLWFLGALAKSKKQPIAFVLPVRSVSPSVSPPA